jgi:hypothetical protein
VAVATGPVATGPAAAAKQEGTCVMSKPAVEAHGLREAFSQVQALDGLSLAVPGGVERRLAGRVRPPRRSHLRPHAPLTERSQQWPSN